jgi:hypothetical protein
MASPGHAFKSNKCNFIMENIFKVDGGLTGKIKALQMNPTILITRYRIFRDH